jgi:hypothetical protein
MLVISDGRLEFDEFISLVELMRNGDVYNRMDPLAAYALKKIVRGKVMNAKVCYRKIRDSGGSVMLIKLHLFY